MTPQRVWLALNQDTSAEHVVAGKSVSAGS
jgi:hypothetical protein